MPYYFTEITDKAERDFSEINLKVDYNILSFCKFLILLLSPAMAKPLGGHRNAGRACVCVSYKACYRDNFSFNAPIYTIFYPVMHPTIALNEFENE